MELKDLRRQTGPNLLLDGPGALAEVWLDDGPGLAVQLWRAHAAAALHAVGWDDRPVAARAWPGGVTLGLGAPLDGTDAACDLLDWAWARTRADLGHGEAPRVEEAAETLRGRISRDARPGLAAIAELARRHDLTFLDGEEQVSLGLGTGCRHWPADALPDPDEVDLAEVHDIPVALVTGTNGKSTTVRLLAAIAAAGGLTPGLSSSDWVKAGDEVLETGDWSGPGGARTALRDPRVELAALEIARGGMMRRGLVMNRADAALVTNIAADHLGEYGLVDIDTLTEAKFLVARGLKPGGTLVLNADDPVLQRRSTFHPGRIAWFSLEPEAARIDAWAAAGHRAAYLDGERLVLATDGKTRPVVEVGDVPVTMEGRARYNIANALGAMLLADILGLDDEAMRTGLAGFRNTTEANPGRGNLLEVGGATVMVDFAHNAHGISAMMEAVADVPAKRRLSLVGHAGNRSDEEIRAVTRAVWQAGLDRIIVKELPSKLRGREPGELPALMLDELDRLGAPDDAIGKADTEIEAVHQALRWARRGDFLVLLTHTQRDDVMALLESLKETGWEAGDPLPDGAGQARG